MSKEMTLIVLGLWVAVVPYLGVPSAWRTALLVLSGIGIAAVGFLLRGETLGRTPGSVGSKHSNFIESAASHELPNDIPQGDVHEHHKEGISSLN